MSKKSWSRNSNRFLQPTNRTRNLKDDQNDHYSHPVRQKRPFDDYAGRAQYARVERWIKPSKTRGRMAKFDINPTDFPRRDMTDLLAIYTKPF